ncbi:hypothetical protein ACP70R_015305 [Stipagrostis hirtigluma subsp. patula]
MGSEQAHSTQAAAVQMEVQRVVAAAAMSSSSSPSSLKGKRGGGIQGPRPLPLSLPASSSSPARPPSKRPRSGASGPVIVYEDTPKVVHARADEFMAVVQRLTGRQQHGHHLPPTGTAPAADPLVLTLGQQQAPPALDHSPALPPSSPGQAAVAGSLLSPGGFLFSPATMRAIQELIS